MLMTSNHWPRSQLRTQQSQALAIVKPQMIKEKKPRGKSMGKLKGSKEEVRRKSNPKKGPAPESRSCLGQAGGLLDSVEFRKDNVTVAAFYSFYYPSP